MRPFTWAVVTVIGTGLAGCRFGALRGSGAARTRSSGADSLSEAARAQFKRDSVLLAAYHSSRGYRDFEIVAADPPYYVSLVNVAGVTYHLVALAVRGDSVVQLLEPFWIGDYAPNLVAWLRLGGSGVNGLQVTFDEPMENVVGTRIYSLAGDSLVVSLEDRDVRRPGRLEDLDGNGVPELIAETDDAGVGEDCSDLCRLELIDRFDLTPAWVRLYEWRGGAWVAAETKHPAFYRRLAERYDAAARWVREGPENQWCQQRGWMRDGEIFAAWARRARELAAR